MFLCLFDLAIKMFYNFLIDSFGKSLFFVEFIDFYFRGEENCSFIFIVV